jgi:GNAT superfamily N-acetyltransferase
VRVDGAGDGAIAVASDRRGDGIGTALGRAALARAIDLHYTRLTLRSTHRSRAARRVGEALGCVVVDVGRGRTDLIVDLAAARRIA